MLIASCCSIDMYSPLLPEVSFSCPLDLNNIHNHSVLMLQIYIHATYCHLWILLLWIVRYPHHVPHMTLMAQVAFTFANWLPLSSDQLDYYQSPFWWISQCKKHFFLSVNSGFVMLWISGMSSWNFFMSLDVWIMIVLSLYWMTCNVSGSSFM